MWLPATTIALPSLAFRDRLAHPTLAPVGLVWANILARWLRLP
jgi:hypothetical protein